MESLGSQRILLYDLGTHGLAGVKALASGHKPLRRNAKSWSSRRCREQSRSSTRSEQCPKASRGGGAHGVTPSASQSATFDKLPCLGKLPPVVWQRELGPGEEGGESTHRPAFGALSQGRDWVMRVDTGKQLQFLIEITSISLHLDIVFVRCLPNLSS